MRCIGSLLMVLSQTCMADTVVKCPTRIHLESGQVVLKEVPANFKVGIPQSSFLLFSFGAYDGPPERQASLKPNYKTNSRASGWKFEGDFPGGKWLSCDYAEGLIQLGFRLDDSIKQCVGIFKHTKNPKLPEAEFRCE